MAKNVFISIVKVSKNPWPTITPSTGVASKDVVAHAFVVKSSFAFCHHEKEQLLWMETVVPISIPNRYGPSVLCSNVCKAKTAVNAPQLFLSEASIVVTFLITPAIKSYVLRFHTDLVWIYTWWNVMVDVINAKKIN
jgi:hypothetical protein